MNNEFLKSKRIFNADTIIVDTDAGEKVLLLEELLDEHEQWLNQRQEVVPHNTDVILSIEKDLKDQQKKFSEEAKYMAEIGNYRRAHEAEIQVKTIAMVFELIDYHKTMNASK